MVWKQFTALFVMLIFVSANVFAQANEDDEIIKVDVALVNIPFSVSDREGRSILGLNAANFSLFEDGKQQKIEYLSTEDAPLNVALLLDTSQSAKDILDKIKNAALQFVKQLRPADRCMIVSFDQTARVKSEFTNNQKSLENAIKRTVLSQKGGTLLHDTLSFTLEKELVKVKGRKAIILISDGKDAGSAITKSALLYQLAESDAAIYSILYQNDRVALPVVGQNQNIKINQKKFKEFEIAQQKRNVEAAEFMGKVSELTGGRTYRKEVNNLSEAFNTIAEELRKQYLISFYPDDPNYDASKHQIKIRVDKKNAVVRMKNYNLLK